MEGLLGLVTWQSLFWPPRNAVWLPLLSFLLPLAMFVVFAPHPDSDSPDEEEANDSLRQRTAVAVGLAVSIWVSVGLTDVGFTDAKFQIGSLDDVLLSAFLLAMPIGYVLWVIWLVGGEQSTLAHPVLVASFFVASVAAHISYFAYVYRLIDALAPHSFSGNNLFPQAAFYLATTTFTSLGPGNLSPTNDAARFAVAAESLLSLVILAVGVVLVLKRWRPWEMPGRTSVNRQEPRTWFVEFRMSGPRGFGDMPPNPPDVYTDADVKRLLQQLGDRLPIDSPRRLIFTTLEGTTIVGVFETSIKPREAEYQAMFRVTMAALLPSRRPMDFEYVKHFPRRGLTWWHEHESWRDT